MGALSEQRVFVDANVFYSRTLRDWLALIYLQGDQPPYQVYWTEDVMAEVVHHLRKNNPLWDGATIARIRSRLCDTFEVGRVEDFAVSDAECVRDIGDLHVHAAALSCQADFLLTCNVRDFPVSAGYEVIPPDDFFVLMDDLGPQSVRAATESQADYWGRRQGEVDLPEVLRQAGCPHFAQRVLRHLRSIALNG